MYRLDDWWVWDFWLARGGSTWHLFHLQAPRAVPPDDRHWCASVGHAVSDDLTSWTRVGTVLEPGQPGSFDETAIWTGSVLRHEGPGGLGRWLLAYTGISRRSGVAVERIGLAWSDDLSTWIRDPANPVLESDPRWFERPGSTTWQHGWRDPHLVHHGDGYSMLLSARTAARYDGIDDPFRAGAVALATSDDGRRWRAGPPVPGTAGHLAQLEVPHLIEAGGRHHLVVCPSTDGPWPRTEPAATSLTGTFTLTGPTARGPFDDGPHVLDADPAATLYAGRVVDTGDGLRHLAFVDGGGRFQGVLTDPVDVGLDARGTLTLTGRPQLPIG